jgi:hypothetical protein
LRRLLLGLDAWVLTAYPREALTVGSVTSFGLLFVPLHLEPSTETRAYYRHVRDEYYDVIGNLLYVGDVLWALNFGLLAFAHAAARPVTVPSGQLVHGTIALAPDPAFWSDVVTASAVEPSAVYSWRILEIIARTSQAHPMIDRSGRLRFDIDEATTYYESIPSTDAPVRPAPALTFLLRCELLGLASHADCDGLRP